MQDNKEYFRSSHLLLLLSPAERKEFLGEALAEECLEEHDKNHHGDEEDEDLAKMMMDEEGGGGQSGAGETKRPESAAGEDGRSGSVEAQVDGFLNADGAKEHSDELELIGEAVEHFNKTKMQTQLFHTQEEFIEPLDPEIKQARLDQLHALHEDPIVVSILSGMLFEHFESLLNASNLGQPMSGSLASQHAPTEQLSSVEVIKEALGGQLKIQYDDMQQYKDLWT